MNEEWKQDKFVHSVTDKSGKQMWFRLKPARENPDKTPIIIIENATAICLFISLPLVGIMFHYVFRLSMCVSRWAVILDFL